MKQKNLQNLIMVLMAINVCLLMYVSSKQESYTPVFSADTPLGSLFHVTTDKEKQQVKHEKRKRVNH